MSEKFEIPPGTKVYIGAPAHPMPKEREKRLAEGISKIEGIAFAYIPQMYIPGQMDESAQVLCIVISKYYIGSIDELMRKVQEVIASVLPSGEYIDVMPLLQDSELIPVIIDTGCCLVVNSPAEHEAYFKKEKFDKLTYPIGIISAGNYFIEIIPAGQQLPYTFSDIFSTSEDNQKILEIILGQEKDTRIKKICEIRIENLPPAKKGMLPILITIKIDEYKRLFLKATISEMNYEREYGPYNVE